MLLEQVLYLCVLSLNCWRNETANGSTHADDARTATHDASSSSHDDASSARQVSTRQIRQSKMFLFTKIVLFLFCIFRNSRGLEMTHGSGLGFLYLLIPKSQICNDSISLTFFSGIYWYSSIWHDSSFFKDPPPDIIHHFCLKKKNPQLYCHNWSVFDPICHFCFGFYMFLYSACIGLVNKAMFQANFL